MSATDEKRPTVCPTCRSVLPPKTHLARFVQSPLFPEKFELGYGEEVQVLLDYLTALNTVLGWGKLGEEISDENIGELNKLATELAEETNRRFCLYVEAVGELDRREYALRKQAMSV